MEPVILRGEAPSGFGSGPGFGSGSGYGSGYGDGSGYGYGSGDGYGVGDGDDGSGVGSGDGYGDGYGYDGDGVGDGSGYGDGYGAYWQAAIADFASRWPAEQQARLAELQAEGATIAYWRSSASGLSANGGRRITPAAPGVVHEIEGPLELCGPGALHATLRPDLWEGERWWIVALTGEVIRDDMKLGALRREIIGECV